MIDRPQTIYRAPHGALPYFQMSRSTAQDKQLSWEARGMLAYLLSQPNDWTIKTKDLEQNCKAQKVRTVLAELEKAKYLKREEIKDGHWSDGRFRYLLYELPYDEKPYTEKPSTEKRDVDKTVHGKTRSGQNSLIHKKELKEHKKESTEVPASAPVGQDVAPKVFRAKEAPKPWSTLTKALYEAMPDDIRPLRCDYRKSDAPAKACFDAGITVERITAFATATYPSYRTWAETNNKPVVMSMHHVEQYIKAWEAKQTALVVPHSPAQPVDDLETKLLIFALFRVTGLDPRLNPDLEPAARKLRAAGYVGEDVDRFQAHYKAHDWRAKDGSAPKLQDVVTHIGIVKAESSALAYDWNLQLPQLLKRLRANGGDFAALDDGDDEHLLLQPTGTGP